MTRARPQSGGILLAKLGCVLAAILAPITARAQLPHPAAIPAGTITSWGDDAMAPVLHAWQQAFRIHHPEVTFADDFHGTGTAMAGLITSTSDLALMGRPADVNEIIGFEWVFRYKPQQVQVLNGSLGRGTGETPSLVVLVSARNPLATISVKQLATILGCPDSSATPTWSLAGAQGPWAVRPIHAYLPDNQTGTGAWLQHAVLGAADCYNWTIVHEFKDAPAALLEAFARDPDGLAITSSPVPNASYKVLRVDDVAATPTTIVEGTYPLARGVYLNLNRKPGTPIQPRTAEFLRFILSPEGQALAAREGTFLPLNAAVAAEQRKTLE